MRLPSAFDLVFARDGREASLGALSEGELELIGFVVARPATKRSTLRFVPSLLLDDRGGGLSDDSLHTVVERFREHVDCIALTSIQNKRPSMGTVLNPLSGRGFRPMPGACSLLPIG